MFQLCASFPLLFKSRAFLYNLSQAEMVGKEGTITFGRILLMDAQNKSRQSMDAHRHVQSYGGWMLSCRVWVSVKELGGAVLPALCVSCSTMAHGETNTERSFAL